MKSILMSIIVIFSGTALFGQTDKPKPDDSKKVFEDMKPDPEITALLAKVNTEDDNLRAKSKKELIEQSRIKGWLIYGEPKNALSLYNLPMIVRKGNLVKVWSKRIDLTTLGKFPYELSLFEINCKDHEYRGLYIMEYNEENKLTQKVEPDTSEIPHPIIPDGFTQALETKACKVIK